MIVFVGHLASVRVHERLTRLLLLAEAVAFASDVDDRRAVQQSVQGGGGHEGVVTEDLAPVAEGLVAGEHDALFALVAIADDLEEQAGLECVEAEVADLVDDEQLGLHQRVELAMQTVAVDGLGEFVRQVHRVGEVHAMPHLGDLHAERDGEVCLADTGWSEQHDVAAFTEIAPRGQLFHDAAIDGGLRAEVEASEVLEVGKLRKLQVEFHALAMALRQLAVEQVAEEVTVEHTGTDLRFCDSC